MSLTAKIDQHFLDTVQFKIAYNHIKYLGIIITRKPEDLRQTNWHKRMAELKANVAFWKTLPPFMVGKINAIKKVILPRFLYLFQSIPSFIPLKFFEKLSLNNHSQSIIFLWNYKSVRITKKHLTKSKLEEEFGFPNFRRHYW